MRQGINVRGIGLFRVELSFLMVNLCVDWGGVEWRGVVICLLLFDLG